MQTIEISRGSQHLSPPSGRVLRPLLFSLKGGEEMKEVWKAIPGFSGFYEASNMGRIRSWRKLAGHGKKATEPRVLKQYGGNNKYNRVCLTRNSCKKKYSTHRLILLAFCGEPNRDYECGHLNSNRTDNRLENLKWVTRKENYSHRYGVETDNTGERNGRSKIKRKDAENIRCLFKNGVAILDIANKYNLSRGNIYKIIQNHSWKEVYSE